MTAEYTPGTHPTYLDGRALVISEADRTAEVVGLAGQEISVLSAIDALSRGVLAQLPAFAVLLTEGNDLRVVLRGEYAVTVGEQSFAGAGIATWSEHLVTDGAGQDVVVGSSGTASEGTRLPVSTGVVLVESVTWRAGYSEPDTDGPDSDTETDPAPEADPHHTVTEVDEVPGEASEPADFDAVHGATIAGRRPTAPVTPPPSSAPSAASPEPLGDHDGHTVAASELRRIRRQAPVAAPAATPKASLTLSTGRTVEVAQPVLIGRAPRVGQSSGDDMPTLVVVDDPYVSSTHLEVRFQDTTLVTIDRSTNGTLLTRPGRSPERLTKDLPTILTSGSVLALSEDLSVSVEIPSAP